jgi:phospholipase/carboxylesterase
MVVLDQPAAPNSLNDKRVLLLNGSVDPIVPSDHPQRLAKLLRDGGARVDINIVQASHQLTRQDVAAASAWLENDGGERPKAVAEQPNLVG